jgi:hypothetical protein
MIEKLLASAGPLSKAEDLDGSTSNAVLMSNVLTESYIASPRQ